MFSIPFRTLILRTLAQTQSRLLSAKLFCSVVRLCSAAALMHMRTGFSFVGAPLERQMYCEKRIFNVESVSSLHDSFCLHFLLQSGDRMQQQGICFHCSFRSTPTDDDPTMIKCVCDPLRWVHCDRDRRKLCNFDTENVLLHSAPNIG